MSNIIWFRSDLRIYDNPALAAALEQGATVGVYCLNEEQWQQHDVAPAKQSLIVRQLKDLGRSLEALNVPLKVLHTRRYAAVPEALAEQAKALNCKRVFVNEEYEWNEQGCTHKVERSLAQADIALRRYHDQCAIAPGDVRTQQGDMYKVFTAFKREYLRQFDSKARALASSPSKQEPLDLPADLSALNAVAQDTRYDELWPAGEDEAHERLNQFIESRVKAYKDKRDFPDESATSRLSPYLAIGALTTRQCLQAAMSVNEGQLQSGRKGVDTWISELIWRDFYRHLLFAYPDLCRHRPFKAETDALPWQGEGERFQAWCEGRTGYPLVDAAMRQLRETAWMHNRLRMVVAMFLTKHLFVDWRLGERFFMQHLVDGDLASNNGGWQWSASTGVDAAPYFRIFNPVRQSERFDPDGAFIRQYLPELKALSNKDIHWPSAQQREQCDYPEPLVDHSQAVAQTKQWFKELSEQGEPA
ncbi:MAG: deoxyribodipyrimidine photo-lyase [Oleiphilaceae bacterium]|nr:deoxyribodipyrimidine photo-lyase [Oleiphilaceae bacterium]